MKQLSLNIGEKSEVKVIASSAYQFRVELVKKVGKDDINGLIGTNVSIDNKTIKDKRLIKITDILGRETNLTTNTLLFYIYDDGTVEKIITLFK